MSAKFNFPSRSVLTRAAAPSSVTSSKRHSPANNDHESKFANARFHATKSLFPSNSRIANPSIAPESFSGFSDTFATVTSRPISADNRFASCARTIGGATKNPTTT
ncbi:hypothetical protein CMV30_09750 [Nibricoccus aquaticus]|uniref:Uncharacterized protein n=1 Tax=Nibricoccus aquaticus TaxID=2576891 RepID=A0A290Q7H3_9BACT|nr:hypothetical protein CMV30_09750 [Nibricoccus aquaticus]